MKTDRERLSELVQEANKEISKRIDLDELTDVETAWLSFADYLISKGVTIPVRCGECKYFDRSLKFNGGYCTKTESLFLNHEDWRELNDFCSYGERKEE